MSVRRIFTIFKKDLFDAIRDARVLVTLLTPLVIGIFYSFAFDDEEARLSATLIIQQGTESALASQIEQAAGGEVDLSIDTAATPDEVRIRIAGGDADIGLVLPGGFDDAVAAGQNPPLEVVLPQSPSIAAQYIAVTLDPILRSMAGQSPPAQINVEFIEEDPDSLSIVDQLSLRTWAIIGSTVLMVAIVSLLAIPVILAEEREKKTIDALVMISSYGEVITAKALIGISYVALMVPILLAITQVRPSDWIMFAGGVVLLAIALLGFGLLLGGVVRNVGQLNTWSGLLLLPFATPIFLIGVELSDTVDRIVGLTPTGAAMKLLSDSATGIAVFDDSWLSVLVLVLWSILFYGLLSWQLSRQRS